MNYLLPLSIIAIGVLLLLGNLNIISIGDIWHLFVTWWPLLIVLWGLQLLISSIDQRRTARKDNTPPPSGN